MLLSQTTLLHFYKLLLGLILTHSRLDLLLTSLFHLPITTHNIYKLVCDANIFLKRFTICATEEYQTAILFVFSMDHHNLH